MCSIMDFFGPIWAIGNCLWVPIKRRINYVKDLRGNFQILNKEVQYLYNRKADIECEINRDMVSKMVTNECKAWLEKVREVEIKMDVIEAELKENKKCLSGWCPWPNICWRKKVGRCIVQVLDDVARLKEESEFGGGVVVDAPLKAVEKLPSSVAEGNTSTDRTVRKILDCIKDDRVQKIGVWGMGGVGKTRVLKIVNNLPDICQMFQIVIWVTVSSNCSLRKVQNEIAQRLSLNLAGESDERIARKLWKHLEAKKYLLLLDDLWERIDLEAVGVPNPSKENGCKIVLTSRSLDVCNKMETNKEIKVEILSNEEAWKLFHEKVGGVVDFPGITQIARCVVDECRGLPLAILVIGGSLRNENDVRVWRNALKELSSAKYEIIDDIEDSVFNKLKFSYDQLSSENVKNCFLYAALYPEDFEIPVAELIEHLLWEGFITEGEKTWKRHKIKGMR
ncbi:PREDICTED: probable disease resistance protein At1g61180 isoform X2 [Nelumbo nucifera]|nr:PREDICTED: probable disease resistance protein At1g61180 isoform X2 [Nelumbo nucifera]